MGGGTWEHGWGTWGYGGALGDLGGGNLTCLGRGDMLEMPPWRRFYAPASPVPIGLVYTLPPKRTRFNVLYVGAPTYTVTLSDFSSGRVIYHTF